MMNIREIIPFILGFLFCLLVQILVLKNIALFGFAFCFLYLGAILVMPPETDKTWFLIIAFLCGLSVDMFTNTLGLNAAASVLVAFMRNAWIARLSTKRGEEIIDLRMPSLGFGRFIQYIVPLILLHHTTLFMMELSSISLILHAVIRIAASTLFTVFAIVVWQSFVKK